MVNSEREPDTGHTEPDRDRESFLGQVRLIVTQRIEKIASAVGLDSQLPQLLPGQMLRTRLASRLAEGLGLVGDPSGLYQCVRRCRGETGTHVSRQADGQGNLRVAGSE